MGGGKHIKMAKFSPSGKSISNSGRYKTTAVDPVNALDLRNYWENGAHAGSGYYFHKGDSFACNGWKAESSFTAFTSKSPKEMNHVLHLVDDWDKCSKRASGGTRQNRDNAGAQYTF